MTEFDQLAAPDLDQFRLKAIAPGDNQREVLTKGFGIPPHLISELYDTHDKCRRQLARMELRIYYSLIPRMKRAMKERLGNRWQGSIALMSWQNFVRHMDKLEQLLEVRSPRAKKLRLDLDAWKKKRPKD